MNELMFKISAATQGTLGAVALGGGVFAAVIWENMPATAFFLIACACAYLSQVFMTAFLEYLIAGHEKTWLRNTAMIIMMASFGSWLIGLFRLV